MLIWTHLPIWLMVIQEATLRYVCFLCMQLLETLCMVFIEFVLSESVCDRSALSHSRNSGEGKEGTQCCLCFWLRCLHLAVRLSFAAGSSDVWIMHLLLNHEYWVQFHCVQEKNLAKTEGRPEPALYGSEDIRPLSIDDFKSAHEQVRTPNLPPFHISLLSLQPTFLFLEQHPNLFLLTAGLCERFVWFSKHERASSMEWPVWWRRVKEEESAELLHVMVRA